MINFFPPTFKIKDFICDIGCGNGLILFQLAKRKFLNLFGIDYSEKAIEFCLVQQDKSDEASTIEFKIIDILNQSLDKNFNVLIDKGTYDAICLTPNSDINLTRDKYFQFLTKHLNIDGYFIIFTCNFTKDEMLNFLCNKNRVNEVYFELIHEFDAPKLSFGGHTGQQVTGLIFRFRKKNEIK